MAKFRIVLEGIQNEPVNTRAAITRRLGALCREMANAGYRVLDIEADYEYAPASTAAPEATDEFPKHTGGGWYELSNGEKVQGKTEALEAEAALA